MTSSSLLSLQACRAGAGFSLTLAACFRPCILGKSKAKEDAKVSEIFPQYDYNRYFKDIFPPNTDPNHIDKVLQKIRNLILVGNFESVDGDADCFKGETVADISCAFKFPSVIFFEQKKSQIVSGLKFDFKPVRVIKPEDCYLSVEQYLNKKIGVDKSEYNNPIGESGAKAHKSKLITQDVIKAAIDDKNLPISKSPSKKIITNRQLNFTLSPVDTYNAKEMPYKLQNYEIDGTWNHHHSIILDAILDRIFNIGYQQYKKPPQSWRSKKTIEVVDKISGGMVNPVFLTFMSSSPIEAFVQKNGYDFRDKLKEEYDYRKDLNEQISFEQHVENYLSQNQEYQEFIRTMLEMVKGFYADYPFSLNPMRMLEIYPFMRRYQYTLIKKLKEIAQARFKMGYKVKFMQQKPTFDEKGKVDGRGQLIDLNYRMNEFQPLFEVMAAQKDEIVLNFKSPLGKLILYNMLILDTDWCPVEAMSLKKNAYFIYKRFLFNRISGRRKAKSIELKLDEIKTFLDLKWSNDRGVNTIIEKALKDLVQNGLITELKSSKKFKNRSYDLHFENGQKDAEKKQK
jgi:hypothetical protein